MLLLAGCATAEIPYEIEKVAVGKTPVHKLRVAVLPMKDARTEGPESDHFVYRGIEYTATNTKSLPGDPMLRVTEVLAKHLARTRSFAQMILVLSPAQAPEADLLLSGEVFRLRGYVEARAPDKKSGRSPDERYVLSEVVLRRLQLKEAKGAQRVLMSADAGWSIFKKVKVKKNSPEPDPWRVMAHALRVAIDGYVEVLQEADLSGAHELLPKVSLQAKTATVAVFGALQRDAPSGWSFTQTSTVGQPIGWKGEKRCLQAALTQKQSLRFHRLLGPYRPKVQVWSCPRSLRYRFDGREEFPALYMGDRARSYFFHAVGESNWPQAYEDLQRYLGLEKPKKKYTFEVGGAP